MKPVINWQWEKFALLSPAMLYKLLQLRSAIFVVEQQSIYLDLDDKDQNALHLLGWVNNTSNQLELAAAGRILFPGDGMPLSFGRIVVTPAYRGLGCGEELISQILDYLHNSPYHQENILISAQYYLLDFYQKFKFKPLGEPYDEDGIKHIKMLRAV
jgi:ElaA protein